MELPPAKLLAMDPDSKLSDTELYNLRLKENAELAGKSNETTSLYRSMRANCRKDRLNYSTDFSVPLEKITVASDLKQSDKFLTSSSTAYNGSECDVDLNAASNSGAKVEKLEKDAVVSFGTKQNLKALLKNTAYAKALQSRGLILSSSVSGVAAKQNASTTNLSDIKAQVLFDINGSYFTASDEIPFKSSYNVLALALSETKASVQMKIIYEIKMPSFVVSLQIHTEGVSEKNKPARLIHTYYVNGYEKSETAIRDMFGQSLENPEAKKVQQLVF